MMRTNRPRRPGSQFGQNNPLYGVTGKFGLIGLLVLFVIGLLVQLNKPGVKAGTLKQVALQLKAPPYPSKKMKGGLLLPATDGRVLGIAPEAMQVLDTQALQALKADTILIAGLLTSDAAFWQTGQTKRNFLLAYTLQSGGGKMIVSAEKLYSWQLWHNNTGAWLMLLSIMLLPYGLLEKPRVNIWLTLLLFGLLWLGYVWVVS